MSALLTRDAILATQLRSKTVEVPEWGGAVRIVELGADAREAIETAILDAREENESLGDVRARYAAACIVGEDGKRLFAEKDIAALAKKSGAALARVHSEIIAFNLLDGDAVETQAKN